MTEMAERYVHKAADADQEAADEAPMPKTTQNPMLKRLLGKMVNVYLTSGTRLEGKLTGFDLYCIVLNSKTLVYKHAICTIMQPLRREDRTRT